MPLKSNKSYFEKYSSNHINLTYPCVCGGSQTGNYSVVNCKFSRRFVTMMCVINIMCDGEYEKEDSHQKLIFGFLNFLQKYVLMCQFGIKKSLTGFCLGDIKN